MRGAAVSGAPRPHGWSVCGRHFVGGVVSTLAALALVSCTVVAAGAATAAPGREVALQAKPTSPRVGAVRAIRIATAAVVRGYVIELELEPRRGTLIWEADVVSGRNTYDVTIHAHTGKVLRVVRDRAPDRRIALRTRATVTPLQAAQISVRAIPGGMLHSLELDRWRGRVVWEAEVVSRSGVEFELVVAARGGTLLSKKIDD